MDRDFRNIRDSYKSYKKTTRFPVDVKTYIDIAARYNKFLVNKVLEGHEVTLPAKIGTLRIEGRKVKPYISEDGSKIAGLAPDWKKTKEYRDKNGKGKIIWHDNTHTDGVRYNFKWSKSRVNVQNKSFYKLRLVRKYKRSVKPSLENGQEYIIEV